MEVLIFRIRLGQVRRQRRLDRVGLAPTREEGDARVPVIPIGKDVDHRIHESGAPEDDVAGHVKAGVASAGGHRVDYHLE